MTSSELGAAADLAFDGFGGTVRMIEDVHGAIAARTPGAAVQDVVARGVYASVRGVGALVGAGVGGAIRAAGGGPAVTASPAGRFAVGALNGLLGDRLDADGSALAVPMGFDVTGAVTPFPVVFVHGLCESGFAWRIRAARHGGTYASRVVDEVGRTSVFVTYNTGVGVRENGARLSALLDDLVAEWPVPVQGLALVGHSMGGLVIRAAAQEGGAWVERVDTTVSLGTPHRGAPLAQAAGLAVRALELAPESRPFGAVLAGSAGIRDLVRGLDTPLIAGAQHHAVAATVSESPGHVVGRVVGDLLVLTASAHGIEDATLVHVGSHDHFDLLNSPALDELLRAWLARQDTTKLLSAG
ncbi:alpha/beta hydrolase [Conexibacter woesei]|uniref:PGAP1-like alpha/beta domain-containing protein n=1 Tax=Conexibacter woesei TaxID=191495 RepID=UPI0003FE1F37|nr:alpha/beta hydrolase [Conexibacter woesei]